MIARVRLLLMTRSGDAVDVDHIVGLRADEAPARHFALERIHAGTRRAGKLDMLGPHEQPRRRRLPVALRPARATSVANALDAAP